MLALAAALTAGASAQQQTFSTAHAGPTGPVPIITGQPVNGDIYPSYYAYPCNGHISGSKHPTGPSAPKPGSPGNKMAQNGNHPCSGTRPSARPSGHPGPHPTQHPQPHAS